MTTTTMDAHTTNADSPGRAVTFGTLLLAHDNRDGTVVINRDPYSILLSRAEAEFLYLFLNGEMDLPPSYRMSDELIIHLLPGIISYLEEKGKIQPPSTA